MNKRILAEIATSVKSDQYDFLYDDIGKYDIINTCYLKFTVKDGMYKGQTHILQIRFKYTTNNNQDHCYPFQPPDILFITPIFHTNISVTGLICLDILHEKWSALYSIENIF